MTLTPELKKDLSAYRLEKAKTMLKDAEILHTAGSYESSVNRAYYALLTAAKALLIMRGIEPETHEVVKSMLAKEFIRTGIVGREHGETFRSLLSRRLDSDYGDFVDIGEDEARDSIERAGRFFQEAEAALRKMYGE